MDNSHRTETSHSLPVHSLPVANYSPAVARAVAWLGDRYLLAKPINMVRRAEKPRTDVRDARQLRSVGATKR
jgi:hypothetical protein